MVTVMLIHFWLIEKYISTVCVILSNDETAQNQEMEGISIKVIWPILMFHLITCPGGMRTFRHDITGPRFEPRIRQQMLSKCLIS
jgi:hypothetical protein